MFFVVVVAAHPQKRHNLQPDEGGFYNGRRRRSVLGPTIFLVYINDLCDNIKAKVRLFADDTISYDSIRNTADTTTSTRLLKDLETLEKWENKWQMSFSVSKCHVLTVTRKRAPVVTRCTLHQQPLEKVASAKYLAQLQ